MPFEKGRPKTGGRTKSSATRRSSKFCDQLKGGGFDYVKELANALKAIKEFAFANNDTTSTPEAIKAAAGRVFELKFYYGELKSLLPYMAPRLREADVTIGDEPETPGKPQEPVSDEDLIKAAANGLPTADQPRPSNPAPVESRNPAVQVPHGAEEDLSRLAGESEESA